MTLELCNSRGWKTKTRLRSCQWTTKEDSRECSEDNCRESLPKVRVSIGEQNVGRKPKSKSHYKDQKEMRNIGNWREDCSSCKMAKHFRFCSCLHVLWNEEVMSNYTGYLVEGS